MELRLEVKRSDSGLWQIRQRGPAIPQIVVQGKLKVRPFAAGDGREVKALDEQGRLRIGTLASTPDIDEMGEIVEPTAFASSIEKFGENPMMLAYHDMGQPVGLWDDGQKITKGGLLLDGFVSAGRPDVQQLVLDGVLAHTSIGFFPREVEWDDRLEVMRITDLELIEVSLVPIPANRSTFVTLKDAFAAWRADEIARLKDLPEIPAAKAPDGSPEPLATEPDMGPLFAGIASSMVGIGRSLARVVEYAAGE
jgi:HK97 family phage prohead protease